MHLADIEWVVSAYVLTFAAFLMPSGALSDRYGRRRMLTVGLAIFTLASLLCGLASSALVLNAARALQGVGAAIELSAALAVLGMSFVARSVPRRLDSGERSSASPSPWARSSAGSSLPGLAGVGLSW